MLDIKNLRAKVGDKEILRGINLHVGAGEVHAIMGPNGFGQEHVGACFVGPGKLRSDRRLGHLSRQRSVGHELRRCARARGSFWRFSIRSKFPASARLTFSRRRSTRCANIAAWTSSTPWSFWR